MTRDTLLLTAVLLAAGFTTRTFAADDPPPVAAEAKPAGFDPFAKLRVREEQDEPPDKPATFERSDDEIKVFSLQNVSPAEVVAQLQVLFPESVKLSAVPSRKTIIARGPAEELRKVEALLLRLDEAPLVTQRWREPMLAPPLRSPAPVAEPIPDDAAAVEEPARDSEVPAQQESQSGRNFRLDDGEIDRMVDHAAQQVIAGRLRELAKYYSTLMDEGRFAEARAIAKQAKELYSEPIVRQMLLDSPNADSKERDEALPKRGQLTDQRKGLREEVDQLHHAMEKSLLEGRHLSVEGLRAEFEKLDAKARELARSKRRSRESDESGSGDVKGLRDAVREAFDARQALQRRELAELAERLAAIQKSLEAREQMKDEIINRRVEELLNPALEWDSPPEAIAKDSGSNDAISSARQVTPPREDGIPLIAAVNAFNRTHTGPDHPYQPPLTEDEVVDAIRNWKDKRNEVAVSDAEFAAFLRIAETRRLPPGYVLGAHTEPARRDGKDVVVSSVLLLLPTPSRAVRRQQDYLIREILLDPDTRVPLSESPPSATGQDTQAVQPIREFDPSRSVAEYIGTVTQVSQGGDKLVIQTWSPESIKKGDILEIKRRPGDADEPSFAEVQVIDEPSLAEGQGTGPQRAHADARLVVSTRQRVGGRDVWMKPEPGDVVVKPYKASPAELAQSRYQLERIMLAFQKYHYSFGKLPPAALTGRENRGETAHRHSWRVAILPFIGMGGVYQQYRFDEPWDSEHNKALLSKMPDVYRSSLDEPHSTHTSYFAVVTPELDTDEEGWRRGTVFSNPQGTTVHDIPDGTSNTIAIVEAKRAVPWTKPEDIPFDVDGALPELGGWFAEGFHAGFADGSVHFVSKDNDARTLRHLLLIQDGAVVEPKFVE